MGCVSAKNNAPGGGASAAVAAKYKAPIDAATKTESPKEEVKDTPKTQEPPTEEPASDEEEDDADDDVVSESEFLKKNPPALNKNKMRTSVSAEAYGEWNTKGDFTPPSYPKSDEQKTRLGDTLSKSFMFRALNQKEMGTVVDAMEEVQASAGARLITMGDNGDYLFVIEKGILECRKEINGIDTLLKTVEEGDVFGELALLYNTVRAANVDAKEDCALWKLDRNTFTHIVKEAAQKKRERYEGFLEAVPLLKDMDRYERSQLCDGFGNQPFIKGDTIIKQGDEGDKFYIVEEGELRGVKEGMEDNALTYVAGDFFGELALLKDTPRAATVTALTDGMLLVLDRGAFKRLFGGSVKMIEAMGRQTVKYGQ